MTQDFELDVKLYSIQTEKKINKLYDTNLR